MFSGYIIAFEYGMALDSKHFILIFILLMVASIALCIAISVREKAIL
jgi:hypothetical protein